MLIITAVSEDGQVASQAFVQAGGVSGGDIGVARAAGLSRVWISHHVLVSGVHIVCATYSTVTGDTAKLKVNVIREGLAEKDSFPCLQRRQCSSSALPL
jgi:hypothetical protein